MLWGITNPPLALLAGCENPKPCQSELIVLEHGSYSGDPVTKVLLQPLTGGDRGSSDLEQSLERDEGS